MNHRSFNSRCRWTKHVAGVVVPLIVCWLMLGISSTVTPANAQSGSQSKTQSNHKLKSQATTINERLADYHGDNESPTERRLRFVYFVPTDREPAKDYRQRLTRVIDETIKFYSQQIADYGLKAQPLAVDRDDDGLLRFVMVKAKQPWLAYNNKAYPYGEKIRNECMPALEAAGIDPQCETIAVFTAVMQWDDAKRRFRQSSPYQGGGNARHGFCWQIDAPPLDPVHLSEKTPNIDDGEYGTVSIGKWNSLFVGGVIHELGHALGLPHNSQRPDQRASRGTSLMGSGNRVYGEQLRGEGRGTFLTFADAVRLVSHPLFSGSDKGLHTRRPRPAQFDGLDVQSDGRKLVVTGNVVSQPATYAVLAYTDPDGRGDYDSIATTCIPEGDGKFRIECTDLVRDKTSELRLVALQVNGDATTHRDMFFSVNQAGQPKIDSLRGQLVLAPVLAELRMGRHRQAVSLVTALPDSEAAKSFATPMLTPPSERPSEPDAEASKWSLCDLRPESAKVGWRMPAYNYSPEDLFIRVRGQVEKTAIYAHANSVYTYAIQAKWKTFAATCAVSDGRPGTVVFIVNVDGQQKWKSPVVKPGMKVDCEVNISGAKSLELVVRDAGDGTGRDHAYWISPTINR